MEACRSSGKPMKSQDEEYPGVGGGTTKTNKEGRTSRIKSSGESSIIKVLYTNADSIMNKLDLLQAQVCELDPDFIAITESWTHDEVTKEMLKTSILRERTTMFYMKL